VSNLFLRPQEGNLTGDKVSDEPLEVVVSDPRKKWKKREEILVELLA
jgi:hypothetical protein